MPTTVTALNILIFLLPGFLILRIVEGLTVTAKPAETTRIIDALVFSLINYLLYSIAAIPLGLKPVPLTLSQDGQLQFTWREVAGFFILVLLAAGIGLALARNFNTGWLYKILRERLQFTRRTGRADVWSDVFSDYRGRWIRVHLGDGTTILGWAEYYSDNPAKRELFLAEAVVVGSEGGTGKEVDGPGILLTEKASIERIEILGARNHKAEVVTMPDKKPLHEEKGERPASPRPSEGETRKDYGEVGERPATPRPSEPSPPPSADKK